MGRPGRKLCAWCVCSCCAGKREQCGAAFPHGAPKCSNTQTMYSEAGRQSEKSAREKPEIWSLSRFFRSGPPTDSAQNQFLRTRIKISHTQTIAFATLRHLWGPWFLDLVIDCGAWVLLAGRNGPWGYTACLQLVCNCLLALLCVGAPMHCTIHG